MTETTTTPKESYWEELSRYDRQVLDNASPDEWVSGTDRFEFYRRKGYDIDDAYNYALAWCRNVKEQRKRRRRNN